MKRETSEYNRKQRLDRLFEKMVDTVANIHVDATQLLWEIKTLQSEILEYPQLGEPVFKKIGKAGVEISIKTSKIEDEIEETRQRITRIIEFFNKEFERQIRNRDLKDGTTD